MSPRLVAIAVAVLIMEGCGHVKPPPPPTPDDPHASCASACAHMHALGCRAGEPTAKGEPCTAVCDNVMTSGVLSWNLGCMSNASDCGAVNACNP